MIRMLITSVGSARNPFHTSEAMVFSNHGRHCLFDTSLDISAGYIPGGSVSPAFSLEDSRGCQDLEVSTDGSVPPAVDEVSAHTESEDMAMG